MFLALKMFVCLTLQACDYVRPDNKHLLETPEPGNAEASSTDTSAAYYLVEEGVAKAQILLIAAGRIMP